MRYRPTILIFNRCFLPGYKAGGPIRTLVNLVDHLGDNFDFRIVTLDRDSGDSEVYTGITSGRWNKVCDVNVRYLKREEATLCHLCRIVAEVSPDAIYLNSFFDPAFTQKILWLRRLGKLGLTPVLVAPRGEFSSGALRLKKYKKLVYFILMRVMRLYTDLKWQASTEIEKAEILRCLSFLSEEDVRVAINLPPVEQSLKPRNTSGRDEGPLKICFLSRITRKKNLDYALRILALVKKRVQFTIYGPKEDLVYWRRCEGLIRQLPSYVSVSWEGPLTPENVIGTLGEHHLFLFPTMGENYGHVIYEALCAALPVLLSDQTPWNYLEDEGIGWSRPLEDNEAGFAKIIDAVASWSDAHLSDVRVAAFEESRTISENVASIKANRDLFDSVLLT